MPDSIAPDSAPPQPAAQVDPAGNAVGAAWMLLSVVTASAMTIAAKELTVHMDSRAVVMWRAGSTVAILLPLLALPWLRARLTFSRPGLHLIRGVMVGVSTHMGFYTIAHLPVATATVLFFTAPIFATMLASPINGERVGPRRWAAVVVGFFGALVILRPGIETVNLAMLSALGSSLLFATALSMSRNVARADGPIAAYVSSIVITVAISLPLSLPVMAMPPHGVAWLAVAVLVVCGAARGYGDIQAYRYGEASVVGAIAYLRLVLIGWMGWLFFDESVDHRTVIGGAIIVGSTLYIAQREARLRRAQLVSKAGPPG